MNKYGFGDARTLSLFRMAFLFRTGYMSIKLWGMYGVFKEPTPSAGLGWLLHYTNFYPGLWERFAPSNKRLVRNPSLNWLLVTANLGGTSSPIFDREKIWAILQCKHHLQREIFGGGPLSKSEVIPILVVQTKNRLEAANLSRCFQLRSKQEHMHQRQRSCEVCTVYLNENTCIAI